MSLSKEDKDYIVEQAEKPGYKSISAFLVSCAYRRISLDVDTSHFYEYSRQIKKIGHNINYLIRDIRTSDFFTVNDVVRLEAYLKSIEGIVKKEKSGLDSLELELNKLPNDQLKKLLENQKLEVPLKYIYENILNDISDSLLLFIGYVEQSGFHQMWIEYIYKFLYEKLNANNLSYDMLVEFSNELFFLLQKISTKLLNPKKKLEEDEFFLLKDIIDKYK